MKANATTLPKFGYLIIFFVLLIFGAKCSENKESKTVFNGNKLYYTDPFKYERLDGKNFTSNFAELKEFNLRLTRCEYESISFVMRSSGGMNNVKLSFSNFTDSKGNILEDLKIDPFIVKVWYQAGYGVKDIRYPARKMLTQELLIKDDSLVIVDRFERKNYLKVQTAADKFEYINISDPDIKFPDNVDVKDSKELLPFNVEPNSFKQVWTIIQIPKNARSSKYSGKLSIESDEINFSEIPINIEVLNFDLEKPNLQYGLYYHGKLRKNITKLDCINKNFDQLKLELEDMKEHGVLYPTNYEYISNIDRNLKVRNLVGLPNDRLYFVSGEMYRIDLQNKQAIESVVKDVENLKNVAKRNNYKQVYVYGIDEAQKEELTTQRKIWLAIKSAGAKMFVATTASSVDYVGDVLDLAILYGDLSPETAKIYQANGNEVFSYANPQVGVEDPEIYRRNYGLALWLSG